MSSKASQSLRSVGVSELLGVTDAKLRRELDRRVLRALAPVSLGLAFLLSLLFLHHLIAVGERIARIPLLATEGAAIACLILVGVVASRRSLPLRLAHPAALVIVLVPIVALAVVFHRTGELFSLDLLSMVVIIAGGFMLSLPWFLAAIGAALGPWMALTTEASLSPSSHAPLLIASVGIGFGLLCARIRSAAGREKELAAAESTAEWRSPRQNPSPHPSQPRPADVEDERQSVRALAHELNNALTAVVGFSDLALQQIPAGHRARDPLDEIRDAAATAVDVTRRLLRRGGDRSETTTGQHDEANAPSPRPQSILVVDDNPSVRDITVKTLSEHGYDVYGCDSSAEAARIFADHDIDLLVTDLVMPNTDGVDLAASLRSLKPSLQVLYMSGYAERLARENPSVGADDFLAKPFRLDDLFAKVRQRLEEVA